MGNAGKVLTGGLAAVGLGKVAVSIVYIFLTNLSAVYIFKT